MNTVLVSFTFDIREDLNFKTWWDDELPRKGEIIKADDDSKWIVNQVTWDFYIDVGGNLTKEIKIDLAQIS